MQVIDTQLEGSLFAVFAHLLIHLFLYLVDHFLYAAGMNPAVSHEALKGQPGQFPPIGVEAGDDHGLGRIVYDQVNSCGGLQRPDVPALAADDASLHLVVGQVNHGHSGLCHVVGGYALNRAAYDLLGLPACLGLYLLLHLLGLGVSILTHLVKYLSHQLRTRLCLSHVRNGLELRNLVLQQRLVLTLHAGGTLLPLGHLTLALCDFFVLLLGRVLLALHLLGLLVQPPLKPLKLVALVAKILL